MHYPPNESPGPAYRQRFAKVRMMATEPHPVTYTPSKARRRD